MICYQKVIMLHSCKQYSKIDDWILQISPRSFSPHNERSFYKRILKYNLLSCRVTLLTNPKTKKYGTDTVAYKATQLWSTLPTRYNLSFSDLFKSEIKNWHCSDSPCNICHTFVEGETPKTCTYRLIISWVCSRSLSRMSFERFFFRLKATTSSRKKLYLRGNLV